MILRGSISAGEGDAARKTRPLNGRGVPGPWRKAVRVPRRVPPRTGRFPCFRAACHSDTSFRSDSVGSCTSVRSPVSAGSSLRHLGSCRQGPEELSRQRPIQRLNERRRLIEVHEHRVLFAIPDDVSLDDIPLAHEQ